MAEALATPVAEVSSAVSSVTEEVSPVVERANDGMEAEVVPDVVPDRGVPGSSHTVDSQNCFKKGNVEGVPQSAWKRKVFCRDEPWLSMHRRMLKGLRLLPTPCLRASRSPWTGVLLDVILKPQFFHSPARDKRPVLSISLGRKIFLLWKPSLKY